MESIDLFGVNGGSRTHGFGILQTPPLDLSGTFTLNWWAH
jgi:hypothetical protein